MEILKNLNVLFVEDETLAREKSQKIFNRMFRSVDIAENGKNAFEIYQKRKYDLIISDINMPIMNGLELAQQIRNLNDNIPIIFLTARNESDYLLKSIELEISDYILKPIDISVLVQKCIKVSEKLKLKSELFLKQKELESVISTMGNIVGITKFCKDGNYTYVNDKYLELTNFSLDELLGKNISELSSNFLSKVAYKNIKNSMQNGLEWNGKIKKTCKLGNEYYVNKHLKPILDENGEVKEYLAINIINTEEELQKKHLIKKLSTSVQESSDRRIKNDVFFQSSIEQLKNENKKINDINTLLDLDRARLQKTITNLSNDIKILKNSKPNPDINTAKHKSIISKLEDELQESKREIINLKNNLFDANNKITSLTKDLDNKSHIIKSYKKEEQLLKGSYEEEKPKSNFFTKILKG